jgi:membrane protease YdiL (CAAX protease family)
LYLTHYFLIPIFVVRNDVPYFAGYLLGYVITMGIFFFGALIAFRREGNPLTWDGLKSRFRLEKMRKTDWLWTVMLIIVVMITYFGLGFTGEWVKSVPVLATRETWPAEFGPGGTSNVTPGIFMGSPLKGQWGLVIVYFIGWFFNIFGEEFFFRGYILPRQELAFGNIAWLVNGLMFTLTHLWQPWILIAILPSSLLLSYAVQSRRNTWIGIIQHGVVNISFLVFIIGGVIGVL